MNKRIAFATLLLASLQLTARAELIVGRVVNHLGQGVGGVDIDVENNGSGGDPDIFNDGTDANGFFSTTISEFGVFDITFNAPPPGATTVLTVQLTDVFVVGTLDMGVIVLPPGVALSGRVVDSGGFPVANINLDVFDASGSRLITPFDRTDLFGNFLIGVPSGPIEVGYDTRPVFAPLLAPQRLAYDTSGDTNVGDVVLPPGLAITGRVLTTLGAPVDNADLDFSDANTGERAYTPGDNTDEFGNFAVTVAAGVYDIQVCPMPGLLLVSREVDAVPLVTSLDLGTLPLEPGFILSGTVTRSHGAPAAGIDINVEDAVTGATIALCDDDTNGAGFYSVIVPIGTYDVSFTQRCAGSSVRRRRIENVLVTGNQALNASLPSGPCSPVRQGPPPASIRNKTVF